MNIIVDTDALLALINSADSLHAKAKALLAAMFTQEVQLFLLPTTLSEFSLIAASRVGLNQTKAVVEIFTEGTNHQMIEIDKELINSAVKLFRKQTSKEESLFDSFVMAATVRYTYDAIFSFDKGYLKKINAGLKLKLVSDLFPNINW
ncbi:PIN domain-containing protein [Patescibacteria group bacterium]|nr:PIN domain-containing protein [Patescibacteria group bacterium]